MKVNDVIKQKEAGLFSAIISRHPEYSQTFSTLTKPLNFLKNTHIAAQAKLDSKDVKRYLNSMNAYDELVSGREPVSKAKKFFGFQGKISDKKLDASTLDERVNAFHNEHGSTIEEIKNIPYDQQKALTKIRKNNDAYRMPEQKSQNRSNEEFTTRVTHPRLKNMEEFMSQFRSEPTIDSATRGLARAQKPLQGLSSAKDEVKSVNQTLSFRRASIEQKKTAI